MSKKPVVRRGNNEPVGYSAERIRYSSRCPITFETFIQAHPLIARYYVRLPNSREHVQFKSVDDKRLDELKIHVIDSLDFTGNTSVLVYLRGDVGTKIDWEQTSLFDDMPMPSDVTEGGEE